MPQKPPSAGFIATCPGESKPRLFRYWFEAMHFFKQTNGKCSVREASPKDVEVVMAARKARRDDRRARRHGTGNDG